MELRLASGGVRVTSHSSFAPVASVPGVPRLAFCTIRSGSGCLADAQLLGGVRTRGREIRGLASLSAAAVIACLLTYICTHFWGGIVSVQGRPGMAGSGKPGQAAKHYVHMSSTSSSSPSTVPLFRPPRPPQGLPVVACDVTA